MNVDDFAERAQQAADLLRAIANERRLMILCELGRGECSVSDLEAVVGLSQSALSQHLAKLRHEGLVTTRRESQAIFYSLNGTAAGEIIQTLYGLYCQTPEPDPEQATSSASKIVQMIPPIR